MEVLRVEEYLLIAEIHLGIDAERLKFQADLGALESALYAPFAGWGETDLYPSLSEKAAILCSRLVRNHPLIDGNKRSAYSALIEFVERNGATWNPPSDPDDAAEMIERLAAREVSEEEFAGWVARHVEEP